MHLPAFVGSFALVTSDGSAWMGPAAFWVAIVLPICFFGLGLIARRLLRLREASPELLPALGLSGFICAGGLLNALHVAFPVSLWILLAIGAAAAAWAAARTVRARGNVRTGAPTVRVTAGAWVLGALVAAIMALTLWTQLAPDAYNWQDDLQKYFVHPVRMLETGTVFGSPLSAIGAESLGGMSLVHACILLWLPLRAINAADAVLGLLLCLLPILVYGWRRPGLWPVAALALLSVVFIDPRYVNISALFLGAALIMAVVFLSGGSARSEVRFSGGSPAAIGLIYAALVALKPTLILFVCPHLVAVACAAGLAQSSPRAGLRWGAAAALFTACFLAPWLVTHLPHYLAPPRPMTHSHLAPVHHSVDLLGSAPALMGLSGLFPNTVLVGGLIVLAGFCFAYQPAPGWRSARRLATGIAAAVAIAAYPVMIFVFPRVVGYADADADEVRYFIPLALGIFPVALCVASESILEGTGTMSKGLRIGLCAFLGLAPLVSFSPTAIVRYRNAVYYHTLLPFPGSHVPELARALEAAVGKAKEEEVRALQDQIPRGSSLIIWTYTPYMIDFARNTVFDAEIAGLSNPWARLPEADYILWEYRGYPDLEARARYLIGTLEPVNRERVVPLTNFERSLTSQLQAGRVLFKDREYVLLRTAHAGS